MDLTSLGIPIPNASPEPGGALIPQLRAEALAIDGLFVTVKPPYVFDANASTYGCVPNSSGFDNSPGLEQALADAVAYAIAHDHVAVVALDPGEYYLTRALQTVEPGTATVRYYSQVRLPFVVEGTTPPVYLLLTSKTPMANSQPLGANQRGTVIFRSTLTGQSYSGTYGWPSMIGGPDEIHGINDITKVSWLYLHVQGIGFRQPDNPSLCCLNHSMIDQGCLEDLRFDIVNTGFGALHPTDPSHPTGIGNLAQSFGLEGFQIRGTIEAHGYYAGVSIGELSQGGSVQVFRSKIGLVVRTGALMMQLDHLFTYHCVTGIGSLSPSSGLVDCTANAGGNTLNVLHINHFLTEDECGNGPDAGLWNVHARNINDPTNVLTGLINFQRNESGVGICQSPLFNVGARNVKCVPLVERIDGPIILWDEFTLRPTEAPGVSMNGRTKSGGGPWATSALAGVTDFVLESRGVTTSAAGASAKMLYDLGSAGGFDAYNSQVVITEHFVTNYPGITNPIVGFIFHYKDASNFMQAFYNFDIPSGGSIVFSEMIAGVNTGFVITSGGIPLLPGAIRELRLELWKKQAFLFLDGVQYGSFQYSAGAIAASIPFYSSCGPIMVEKEAWITDFCYKQTVG